MKRLAGIAALCGLVLSGALPAAAAPSDQMFVNKAAMGGMAEVREAQLALTKTSSPRVRAFAHRMIADHTPNNAMLARIARRDGYSLPMSIGRENMAMMDRLSALNGAAFDAAYLHGQIAAHMKMLALMQSEASSAGDPRLVRFAGMTAPVVQSHLSMARMDVMHRAAM